MRSFWRSWFPTQRFWIAVLLSATIGFCGLYTPALLIAGKVVLTLTIVLLIVDTFLLYRPSVFIDARRVISNQLSLGEDNPVEIIIIGNSPSVLSLELIDEMPEQLQARDSVVVTSLSINESQHLHYLIRPLQRGVYLFGSINVFASTVLGLLQRRFECGTSQEVSVYPSVLEMRRSEMEAFTQRSWKRGTHRMRRLGHTMEFEKIRTYVQGDDIRSLNWKATARSADLMINQYQDERAQPIYAVLDLGRAMYAPFEGMTSLDHAVNASLAFCNVALKKHDQAGLITYGASSSSIIVARDSPGQLARINEGLYNISSEFEESNDEELVALTRRYITQRSLLMLYTNAEAAVSIRRRMPYFKAIARRNVLVVVLFENTELQQLVRKPAETSTAIVLQTVARDILINKQEMVRELRHHGIYGVVAQPRRLSHASINAYLDLKSRGVV